MNVYYKKKGEIEMRNAVGAASFSYTTVTMQEREREDCENKPYMKERWRKRGTLMYF